MRRQEGRRQGETQHEGKQHTAHTGLVLLPVFVVICCCCCCALSRLLQPAVQQMSCLLPHLPGGDARCRLLLLLLLLPAFIYYSCCCLLLLLPAYCRLRPSPARW